MKKWILFIVCLLMVQLSFSQTKYPQKQIQQGDTIVVITSNQLAIVNRIIQDRNSYRDEIVPRYEYLVSEQDSLIQVLKIKVVDWEKMDAANQSIISNLKLQEQEVLRQKKRNAWVIGSVSLSVGVLVGALVVGLSK